MTEPARDFASIRRAAETALDAARTADAEGREDFGAVNWGDLGVVEVLRCEDEQGDMRWRVLIEEASPDCGLALHVYSALAVAFPEETFDVSTEW